MAASQSQTALVTPPYSYGEARHLSSELKLSEPVAVTLVRRGYRSTAQARAFLEAAEEHDPFAFEAMSEICERLLEAASAGRRITVHGDYDVDGVCATAILVGALRAGGAECDWYIPRRGEGYGLTERSVEALTRRGAELVVTVDCGIGSAREVSSAQKAGMEVIVTDHHSPRGQLPACPILHPRLSGYPFGELCAAGVAHKLALALRSWRGEAGGEDDLDLVALATVADMVPLLGENRRLVREGLVRARRTSRPGLRALMASAHADPTALDERDLGFRLAPRINAAGRLYRADAGVELMLTGDPDRAAQIAEELERANSERRAVEQRVLYAAEAALGQLEPDHRQAPALVLAGDDWHPGVIGIVASRLVERHWRPVVLIAADGTRGRGSARSIPGFDLAAALARCDRHLVRHGGHSGAAGLEIETRNLDAFREDFVEIAREWLPPEALSRSERVDALVGVGGEGVGLELAEQLERLGPFGAGNPGPRLLMPSALLGDVRPMGKEGSHARFQIRSGSGRARGVAFNVNGELSGNQGRAADLRVSLEVDQWNGAVQPRVILEEIHPLEPEDGEGCPGCAESDDRPGWWARLEAERALPSAQWPQALLAEAEDARGGTARAVVDRRGGAAVAALAELVSSGESVLALCADASRRRALATSAADPRRFGAAAPAIACCRCPDRAVARTLAGGAPSLALADWGALARAPAAARGFEHVVLVDPPPFEHLERLAAAPRAGEGGDQSPWASGFLHLAWGPAEHELALRLLGREWQLRSAVAEIYDALRDRGGAGGPALRELLAGDSPYPRSAEVAGRCVRVLCELGLLAWEPGRALPQLRVLSSKRTELDGSEAYRAYRARHEEGTRYLRRARQQR